MMVLFLLGCPPAPTPEDRVRSQDTAEELPTDTGPTWTACEGPQPVRLNEVLAANHHGAVDADGDSSDFVELSLTDGTGATALDGWGLSDDGTAPWMLPQQELAAAPLLVRASGKNRQEGELHADFSLDALGDELFLHAPSGCIADHLVTPRMYADTAYGRTVDGGWAWFMDATPGASNTTEARPAFADLPGFSIPGGFVVAGTDVDASGTGTLRYTLDGSVPDADSEPWRGSLTIDSGEPMVVRLRAFVDGLWPSRVATRTWIVDAELRDAGVTVIALTAEPRDLFDPLTGIYEYGPPDYETWYPYFGANFWEVWERDVHVEVFEPGGAPLIDADGGIQIAGGYSRAFPQRNFELIARTGYGPAAFEGRLFVEEEISEWSRLYLRNGGDWCSSQIVDASVQSLFRDDDGTRNQAVDAQAYAPAMVTINGEFWGLYELKERLDESWPAAHRGADPDQLDLVKLGWTHDANWSLEAGSWDAFDEMESFVASEDLGDDDALAAFLTQVDGDNLAAAAVAQGWIGNGDWWWNNLRIWRPRDEDGRFRWMVYDFGHGWGDPNYDHLATTVSQSFPGMPVGEMLLNEGYAGRFATIHADFLNTSLRPEEASRRVRALADGIRPVMQRQLDRWCSGTPLASWEAVVDYAAAYAEARPAAMRRQLRAHLPVDGTVPLALFAEPEAGGRFELAVVTVASRFEGDYYQGVPIAVTAIPAEGYRFVEWSDGAADAQIELAMEGATSLTATFARE
ncbi:MAG: hypothetical protein EXR71_02680 [Myxococcales bacterium]|nr:hypothetical protein [Myxococcales bacterium]